MKVGIVGLPNAGKSSLFNALTRAGAEAAGYPFTTVEPNVAVVPVRDPRLDQVAATLRSSPAVYEILAVHDIAGLVRGAHAGEGLGNRFLAQIRETDALLHVVRAHEAPDVPHPEGTVDPARDLETVETELLHADLEQAESRLERVARQAKSGERSLVAEEGWLRELVEALGAGRPARALPPPAAAPDALANLRPLTAKPVLYVANVGEEEAGGVPSAIAEHAVARSGRAVAIAARLEAELAELEGEEAVSMRRELGAPEEALDLLVREAFELLDLISFFTAAGEGEEARARAIPRGTTARRAAGTIHTDMERGFVRAEVIDWRELVAAGGYAAAREAGTLRTEGRDYKIRDGEVMTVRFTT